MTTTAIQNRIKVEKRIVHCVVDCLINAGFFITVWDGDDDCLISDSMNKDAIIGELFSMDEDQLFVRNPDTYTKGWIQFVYGNDGFDVIADYTTNLDDVLKPATELAESLES